MSHFEWREYAVDFFIFIVVVAFLSFSLVVITTAKNQPEPEPSRCVDESGHFERECP